MKKKSRKTLVRLLDKKTSEEARYRAGNFCHFCVLRGQSSKPVEVCFHFLSRQTYNTRWDRRNVWGSCYGCNALYEADASFVTSVVDWYKQKFGQEQWERLVIDYHTIRPIKTWELEEKLNS